MTGRRGPARAGPGAEAAVSSVVSAVMLFALFTTAAAMWTFNTLPAWVADREEAHAKATHEAFGAVVANLDALSAGGQPGPATTPVPLAPRPVALLQREAPASELRLEEGAAWFNATFTGEELVLVDGAVVGEASEAADGDTLAGAAQLLALQIRLQTSDVGADDQAWVQAEATDGSSTVTARLSHVGSSLAAAGCSASELRLSVATSAGTTTQFLGCSLASSLPGYAVDLMDPLRGFAAAVDRLQEPFALTLTDGAAGGAAAATGTFAAVYRDAAGLDQAIGAGQAASHEVRVASARLAMEPHYNEYVYQELVLEPGGIVLQQGDGGAVLGVPDFRLAVDGGTGFLAWTVLDLAGDGSVGGRGSASVQVRHLATTDVLLTASAATLALDGPSAGAWARFLEDKAVLAGTGSDVSVTQGADGVQVDLASVTVSEWRIRIRVIEAEVVLS